MPNLSRFLMEQVELPLVPVVADMEECGYPVEAELFRGLRQRLEPLRMEVLSQLRGIAGPEFNPESTQQVARLLFEHLHLPITGRTEKGQPATNKAALECTDHDAARLMLQHRSFTKILNTYCCIPEALGPDCRLHVEFNQLGTRTGRFTSQSIIQTIPKNDDFGLRRGFRAGAGMQIVAADFDQQELRILAGVSGDDNMLDAIQQGVDLHGLAAVKIFGLDCDPNEVAKKRPEERQRVKAIQFGLIYGRSPTSLASTLEISKEDARKLQVDYFKQFPKIKNFVEEAHRRVERDGLIADIFGRVRHLPDARQKKPRKAYDRLTPAEKTVLGKINAAKREAQNFLIQGPAATITKLAMLACHRHLQTEHPEIKMILQVHDELHFEVPAAEVDHFAGELSALMCELDLDQFAFHVPMSVAIKVGPSWGELTTWEGRHVTGTDAAAPA
jgi:DNA polymerase-1